MRSGYEQLTPKDLNEITNQEINDAKQEIQKAFALLTTIMKFTSLIKDRNTTNNSNSLFFTNNMLEKINKENSIVYNDAKDSIKSLKTLLELIIDGITQEINNFLEADLLNTTINSDTYSILCDLIDESIKLFDGKKINLDKIIKKIETLNDNNNDDYQTINFFNIRKRKNKIWFK